LLEDGLRRMQACRDRRSKASGFSARVIDAFVFHMV
jgi:hypothetical protein